MITMISCDPGHEGGLALWDENGLVEVVKNEHRRKIIPMVFPHNENVLGVMEENHAIYGQSISNTFAQGVNQGKVDELLSIACYRVEKVSAQSWMRDFGVPAKMEVKERKHWIKDKAERLLGQPIILRLADAVAIGLTYRLKV